MADYSPKKQLIANLQRILLKHPHLSSAEALARVCYWPSGKKKGKKIAPRTIRYVFDDAPESPSPTLDVIVALAMALHCQPWELLVNEERTRRDILEQILGAKPAQDTNLPKPPKVGVKGNG